MIELNLSDARSSANNQNYSELNLGLGNYLRRVVSAAIIGVATIGCQTDPYPDARFLSRTMLDQRFLFEMGENGGRVYKRTIIGHTTYDITLYANSQRGVLLTIEKPYHRGSKMVLADGDLNAEHAIDGGLDTVLIVNPNERLDLKDIPRQIKYDSMNEQILGIVQEELTSSLSDIAEVIRQ